MNGWRIALYTLLIGIFVVPTCALAEEAPCRREGDRVSCTNAGFKVLTDKIITLQGSTKELEIKLTAEEQHAADLKKAVDDCIATIPPPPPPPSKVRPTIGFAMAVIGGLLVGAAPLPESKIATPIMIVSGIALAGGSYFVLVP
jgi:hypothetical protein